MKKFYEIDTQLCKLSFSFELCWILKRVSQSLFEAFQEELDKNKFSTKIVNIKGAIAAFSVALKMMLQFEKCQGDWFFSVSARIFFIFGA